jgi:hypothetical protein
MGKNKGTTVVPKEFHKFIGTKFEVVNDELQKIAHGMHMTICVLNKDIPGMNKNIDYDPTRINVHIVNGTLIVAFTRG